MATGTGTPLDQGLMNGLGGTFFKQLADGHWACFFFGGKKGRILPSEATGRLFRWVSSTGMLLGFVALSIGLRESARWIAHNHPTTSVWPILAVGFAAWAVPVLVSTLWIRRRYRRLPITEKTLSREETRYQVRAVFWILLAAAPFPLFMAGALYAENNYELIHQAVLFGALGIFLVGLSGTALSLIIRAARRRASNPPETA